MVGLFVPNLRVLQPFHSSLVQKVVENFRKLRRSNQVSNQFVIKVGVHSRKFSINIFQLIGLLLTNSHNIFDFLTIGHILLKSLGKIFHNIFLISFLNFLTSILLIQVFSLRIKSTSVSSGIVVGLSNSLSDFFGLKFVDVLSLLNIVFEIRIFIISVSKRWFSLLGSLFLLLFKFHLGFVSGVYFSDFVNHGVALMRLRNSAGVIFFHTKVGELIFLFFLNLIFGKFQTDYSNIHSVVIHSRSNQFYSPINFWQSLSKFEAPGNLLSQIPFLNNLSLNLDPRNTDNLRLALKILDTFGSFYFAPLNLLIFTKLVLKVLIRGKFWNVSNQTINFDVISNINSRLKDSEDILGSQNTAYDQFFLIIGNTSQLAFLVEIEDWVVFLGHFHSFIGGVGSQHYV